MGTADSASLGGTEGRSRGPDTYDIEPVEKAPLYTRLVAGQENAAVLPVNRLETNTCRDSFGPRRIDLRTK